MLSAQSAVRAALITLAAASGLLPMTALGAVDGLKIRFVPEIRASLAVKAAQWDRKKDKVNEVQLKILGEVGRETRIYLDDITVDVVSVRTGEWTPDLRFELTPSLLRELALKVSVTERDFEGASTGFDWFDIIPYVTENATNDHPIADSKIPMAQFEERLLNGESLKFTRSFKDGSVIRLNLDPAPAEEVTFEELDRRYDAGCAKLKKHYSYLYNRSGTGPSQFASYSETLAFENRVLHLRKVLMDKSASWNKRDCIRRFR